MKANPLLRETILEVVDNQLAQNDPPETRRTLERLIGEGYSKNEAKALIGQVVSSEVFHVVTDEEPFNLERFVSALESLPEVGGD